MPMQMHILKRSKFPREYDMLRFCYMSDSRGLDPFFFGAMELGVRDDLAVGKGGRCDGVVDGV